MPKPPAVFKIIPWPRGCPRCKRYTWARLSRLGGWFCVSCGYRQTEEPK